MSPEDLPQVLAIENLCYSTPWSLNSFRYETGNKEAFLKVGVYNGQITGYVCVRTILDLTHLMNIAVAPEFRRKGIASMLLKDVIGELKRLKPDTRLTLEVRQSNIAAIRFYERFGFKTTGKRNGYYQSPPDNAIIMELDISAR